MSLMVRINRTRAQQREVMLGEVRASERERTRKGR